MQSINFTLIVVVFLSLVACKQGTPAGEEREQVEQTDNNHQPQESSSSMSGNVVDVREQREERVETEVPVSAEPYKAETTRLDYITKYEGEYPSAVNFLGNLALRARMKILLGENLFASVEKLWKQETLIEVEGGYIYTTAQQGPETTDSKVAVMIDVDKDILFVGVKNIDKNVDKIYAERNADIPVRLKNWAIKK